ncbi:MAG: nitroreductase family protein [Candidatus Marinimicrobia bacterium]|nr:nitroreductase family protein [Candidatus Neomarinimicrobiota bacterium]
MNFKDTLNKRRSVRSLEKIEISDQDVKKLAKAASLAPSCFNNQPWNYVFVRDQDTIDEIVATMPAGNQKWTKNASMIVGVFAKKDDDCVLGDREYYLFDTGLATQNLLLQATEMGLVAHPIAGYNKEKTSHIMNIPDDYNLITLLVVGKRADEIASQLSDDQKKSEKNRPPRKDIDEIAFFEEFSG